MMVLVGIVIGVAIFSALAWSVYRAVITTGLIRINAIVVSLGTLLGMAGLSYQSETFLLISAPACMLFGLAQMMTDPKWTKLFPLMQFLFGFVLINLIMYSGA